MAKLMLRSNQLAAAVIGSTSLAEDAGHLTLGTSFFDLIEDGRIDDRGGVAINTLGEVLPAAKADLATTAQEHVESNYKNTQAHLRADFGLELFWGLAMSVA